MLNRSGNPTVENLGIIIRSIAVDLGIRPRVEVALFRRRTSLNPKNLGAY